MRIESSVTSVSWIPSEAIAGMTKLPFEVGVAHYDNPLPDVIHNLEELRDHDSFRFANRLHAWVEIEDGKIVAAGQDGQGYIGSTTMRLGKRSMTFPAIPLPDIRPEPEWDASSARFVQTAGGRTGVPAPRRVSRKPFVQVAAPLAWTTLSLTINADGTAYHEVVGASPFPRHWVYDHEGKLAAKTGLVDFKTWYREAFGDNTPWGGYESPTLVTETETALERELSTSIMRGGEKPKIRKLATGDTLTEQGAPGTELFLLLDGVLTAEVDGEGVAELGPGAILGERAVLEGGTRTATLRAVTPCKVAVAGADQIDPAALAEVAEGHRREENRG